MTVAYLLLKIKLYTRITAQTLQRLYLSSVLLGSDVYVHTRFKLISKILRRLKAEKEKSLKNILGLNLYLLLECPGQ